MHKLKTNTPSFLLALPTMLAQLPGAPIISPEWQAEYQEFVNSVQADYAHHLLRSERNSFGDPTLQCGCAKCVGKSEYQIGIRIEEDVLSVSAGVSGSAPDNKLFFGVRLLNVVKVGKDVHAETTKVAKEDALPAFMSSDEMAHFLDEIMKARGELGLSTEPLIRDFYREKYWGSTPGGMEELLDGLRTGFSDELLTNKDLDYIQRRNATGNVTTDITMVDAGRPDKSSNQSGLLLTGLLDTDTIPESMRSVIAAAINNTTTSTDAHGAAVALFNALDAIAKGEVDNLTVSGIEIIGSGQEASSEEVAHTIQLAMKAFSKNGEPNRELGAKLGQCILVAKSDFLAKLRALFDIRIADRERMEDLGARTPEISPEVRSAVMEAAVAQADDHAESYLPSSMTQADERGVQ